MATVSGLAFPSLSNRNFVQSGAITMRWENMGIVARKVDKLGIDIRSFRVPLKRSVQEVVIPSIQMNFHKYGRPRWDPLVRETTEKKGHSIPLHLTGALRNTMKQIGIWKITTDIAVIPSLPSRVWYGGVHQMGAKGGRAGGRGGLGAIIHYDELEDRYYNAGDSGAIPARPFAMIQKEDEEKIQEIFSEWLAERINRAGLGPARGL